MVLEKLLCLFSSETGILHLCLQHGVPGEHEEPRPSHPTCCLRGRDALGGKKREGSHGAKLVNGACLCKHRVALVSFSQLILFLVPLSLVFLTAGGLNRLESNR